MVRTTRNHRSREFVGLDIIDRLLNRGAQRRQIRNVKIGFLRVLGQQRAEDAD
jgi:hypothetical protein